VKVKTILEPGNPVQGEGRGKRRATRRGAKRNKKKKKRKKKKNLGTTGRAGSFWIFVLGERFGTILNFGDNSPNSGGGGIADFPKRS